MKQDELDKFLKGKLEEQSFDFNPGDWENALKLIEGQDTKRRSLWIWWAAAGLALMLGAAYILSMDNASFLSNLNIASNEATNNDRIGASSDKKVISQTNNSSGKIINEEVQIEEALVSQVERSTSNDSDIVTVKKEVIPKITSLKTAIINLPDPMSGNHSKFEPISSPVSESVADVRTGEDFSLSNPTEEDAKQSQSVLFPLDKSYSSQSSIFTLIELDRKGEDHYRPDTYSWETPKQLGKIHPLNEAEVKLGFGYGVSAYVNPYVANLDGDSKSITGFSGGLSTMYRINRGISINADLLYTYRTGTFDKSNIAETKRYSFEALDAITTLNPTALHYASIPVYAGIHFGRHRVTVGGSFNYLGGVQGNVVDQTIATGGVIVDKTTQSGWILKDGFTKLNMGGMIGYDYAINNRWNITFRSNYLFNNIVDQSISERINSFIIKENSQVNLQIGSTYYFK